MSARSVQVLALFFLVGCGHGKVATVPSSHLYGGDSGLDAPLRLRSMGITLPPVGELYLFPKGLFLRGVTSASGSLEDPDRVRLQVALRLVRKDGGVRQWWLGADRRATTGEGGFQVARTDLSRGVTISFDGMRLGPVRQDTVAALQVIVSEVAAPGDEGRERWLAGAALRPAALMGEPIWEEVGARVRSAGGILRLAAHVPVQAMGDQGTVDPIFRTHITLLSVPGDEALPDVLDGASREKALESASAAALGLALEVQPPGVGESAPEHAP